MEQWVEIIIDKRPRVRSAVSILEFARLNHVRVELSGQTVSSTERLITHGPVQLPRNAQSFEVF